MDAPAVIMYATGWCPYCSRARNLLNARGVAFTEIDVESRAGLRDEMARRSGRRTVPQIFVGDRHIGDSDDLLSLDASGELEGLLGRAG